MKKLWLQSITNARMVATSLTVTLSKRWDEW